MKTFTKIFFHRVLGFLCAAVVVVYDPENIFTISSICCIKWPIWISNRGNINFV